MIEFNKKYDCIFCGKESHIELYNHTIVQDSKNYKMKLYRIKCDSCNKTFDDYDIQSENIRIISEQKIGL